MIFAAEHLNAWMSALNEARLILGEIFRITDADMETTDFDVPTLEEESASEAVALPPEPKPADLGEDSGVSLGAEEAAHGSTEDLSDAIRGEVSSIRPTARFASM